MTQASKEANFPSVTADFYTPWSNWTICSDCDNGVRNRSRTCLNNCCTEELEEGEECSMEAEFVANWSEWEPCQCLKTSRTRACANTCCDHMQLTQEEDCVDEEDGKSTYND